MAFEQIEKVDSLSYRELSEGKYAFIDRTIRKGAALLSNTEMDIYFNTLFNSVDNGHRFAVTSHDGKTKYYSFTYIEPPISIENHHAFVLLYAPVDRITHEMTLRAKPLPAADELYLSEAIADPYTWTIIDAKSAKSLQTLLADRGSVFTVSNERGNETIQLMYIVPFSEELDEPEFQAMYSLTASSQDQ